MADVIKSRKGKGLEIAKRLKLLSDSINKSFKKEILSPLTITLGDEFQGVVSSPKSGKEVIVSLKN